MAGVARKDEIDPELIALARPRRAIGPVLALSVLSLCAYLMITLRADLRYALVDKTPTDVGDVVERFRAGGGLDDNSYVTTRAVPDRAAPAWLIGKHASGHRLAPVLGTGGKLWLQVSDDTSAAPVYDERYAGRVRRLEDLAFAGELRRFVAAQPPLPRLLDPATLASGAPRDVFGDEVVVGPDTPFELDERVPGVATVHVWKTETVTDQPGARAAILAAGVTPIELVGAHEEGLWSFKVEASAEGGAEAVRARLAAAGLKPPFATVEDVIQRRSGAWGALGVVGPNTVRLIALVRPTLPADVTVLVAGESPATYWYVPPLYGLLALIAALMIWALSRGLRPEKAPKIAPAEM